jgi:hypothetical protein
MLLLLLLTADMCSWQQQRQAVAVEPSHPCAVWLQLQLEH